MNTRKRLLLVEDDPKFRFALQSVLESHGYQVTAAASAEEARKLDGDSFSAAIIDVRLPKEKGSAFAQDLSVRHKHIKIIFVTAYDDLENAESRIEGASLLVKPINTEALLKLL